MQSSEHTGQAVVPPSDITLRPATFDDLSGLADLYTASFQDQGRNRRVNVSELMTDFKEPGFDLETASQVAVNADGDIVGVMIVWDNGNPPITMWTNFAILPSYHTTTLGQALLQWGIERARQSIARCPDDARVAMRTGTHAGYEPYERIFEAVGFQNIRYFFRMLIEMDEAPPAPQLPEGISIRAYRHPEELETMLRALLDGFRDHWGFFEEPFEDELKHMRHHLDHDEHFDASLHFLAVDDATGQIAGLSLCRKEEWGYPTHAYVKELAVLRDYRKRGVGLALLHHTFNEFWQRGQKRVSLHVDGASLTGATRLYERAGMHITERSSSYELELRAGRNYTTTSVEET